jgi:hypothetical protein
MSLGPVLDVAIGLIFVYLLMGMVASGLKEAISGWLNWRGKELRKGLEDLLAHQPAEGMAAGDLFQSVFRHGLIAPPGTPRDPSYVAARTFSTALIDTLATGSESIALTQIKQAIADLPEGRVRQTLAALALQAGTSVDGFRDSVEQWFDNSMDRVSGSYKRIASRFLLTFGIAAAVLGNVDTIVLVQVLWTQPGVRSAIVEQATDFAQTNDAASVAAPSASAPASAAAVARSATERMVATALPIGWSADGRRTWLESTLSAKLIHLTGWLITGLAVAMGAPFWFDLLNNVLNLRAAGPKPKRADEGA